MQSHPIKAALTLLVIMVFALAVALLFSSPAPPEVDTFREIAVATTPATAQTTSAPKDKPSTPVTSLSFASNGNGTCTVSGLGNDLSPAIVIPERSPVGDRVTSIAPRAFYGCDTVTAIHIPASVTYIGDLAFANCKNLAFLSVSEENSHFRTVDGVLFSKSLATLILYPPKRAGDSFSLSQKTTTICEMAFYHCTYLKSLSFAGSAAQWDSLSIGKKNYSLYTVSIIFKE